MENVKSRQLDLQVAISMMDADLKALQAALRQKEDEAGGLQRERVSECVYKYIHI